jgi:iron(III) transport system permease protein
VAVGVPLAGLVVRSANVANLVTSLKESRAEALHSTWLAAAGALLIVVIAVPLVTGVLRAHRARRTSPAWIMLVNLVVPGSLLALGMISVLSPRPVRWVQDTELPLIVAYATRFVPLVVLVLFVAWLRLTPLASAAAKLHCASWRTRVLTIALPPRAPAIVTSLALAALLIAAELEISLILVRPGPTTLGVRLYTLIHIAPDAVVSALSLDLLLMVIGMVVLALGSRALILRALRGGAC